MTPTLTLLTDGTTYQCPKLIHGDGRLHYLRDQVARMNPPWQLVEIPLPTLLAANTLTETARTLLTHHDHNPPTLTEDHWNALRIALPTP